MGLIADEGRRVAGTLRVVPDPKVRRPAPPEPRGQGTRVVMQRLSITLKGILTQPFMFQVPPLDELPVQREWNYTDYDTVGAGIHTRPGSSQLAVVSFDSLFVDADAPFVVNRAAGFNPVALIDELVRIGESKTPFQLLVGQPSLWGIYYDVNMAATMRTLRSAERAGERDARYFSISFTQFRGISASELATGIPSGLGPAPRALSVTTQPASPSAGGPREPLAVLDIDSLRRGKDTLRDISLAYYGTSTLWPLISRASGINVAGSVHLRERYASFHPKPKIIVPAASRGRQAA